MENVIRDIVEGVSNTFGDDFFQRITLLLAKVIGADFTFIAKLNKEAHTSQTIALIAEGKVVDNIEYSLTDTPCNNVADDAVCCYPNDVCNLFPKDQLLVDMGVEAYLGTPLHDSQGQVMGLIVALYKKPIQDQSLTLTLFQVFSGRISAEVERQKYLLELRDLNNSLEAKVQQRTVELSETISRLEQTQSQLVEAEKMAALGNLVAGVAHEVNTPLGISITSHSVLEFELKQLQEKINNHSLTNQQMDQYLTATEDALALQGSNLQRAATLIQNFKQTAVEQHTMELESINLHDYYQRIVVTLQSLLNRKHVDIKLDMEPNIKLVTYPGLHAQILTNLISNSVMHAFTSLQDNHITITAVQTKDHQVEVTYQDNGKGLSEEVKEHIFEPFFTTARTKGGCGLGMSIIYNLITQKLSGSIKLNEVEQGFSLTYQFTGMVA
jgi:C4-dicarboxylate-specific signal transduction histidine kinase